ncbi:MAG TPA: response regulator [Acidobacteriota bacterium]|nr:response regulator [Acidobacteriota bacterium]
MKKILFVDDDPQILQGLRRMLRSMRAEWHLEFAESGEEALGILSLQRFDVVVSDMKMHGMDGAELLGEVKRLYPWTVRLILSGHSDRTSIMKALGPSHQYLSKPCDPDLLKATVDRACRLRGLLQSDHLAALVSQMESLPSLPQLFRQVVEELKKPEASLKKVGQLIEKDVAMSANILKIVNSSYFGLVRTIDSVSQAVVYLGLDTVNSLILASQLYEQFSPPPNCPVRAERLWEYSLSSAELAKSIAVCESDDPQLANDSYTAALLHDVGMLVLAMNLPEEYCRVLKSVRDGSTFFQAERQIFGATHPEAGAYLLGLWGLPDPIVEAVAYHLEPSRAGQTAFSPLTAVHVASAWACERSHEEGFGPLQQIDSEYMESLGLESRLEVWREACREHFCEVAQ